MPTLVQILQAKLGNRFKDVRADMPRGAGVYAYVDSRKMSYIVLHYSAGLEGPVSPKNIAEYHVRPVAQGGKGWPGIGYHFVIDEGIVYHVGSVDTQRAHVLGRNDEGLGVCFAGTYDTTLPSARNVEAVKLLIEGLDDFYKHKKRLEGHNQQLPGHTACPGRINELIPTLRAPVPVPVPKPQPHNPPLPEDELLNPNLTLKVLLEKALWWAQEQERAYVAKKYSRASDIRRSMMILLDEVRKRFAA